MLSMNLLIWNLILLSYFCDFRIQSDKLFDQIIRYLMFWQFIIQKQLNTSVIHYTLIISFNYQIDKKNANKYRWKGDWTTWLFTCIWTPVFLMVNLNSDVLFKPVYLMPILLNMICKIFGKFSSQYQYQTCYPLNMYGVWWNNTLHFQLDHLQLLLFVSTGTRGIE